MKHRASSTHAMDAPADTTNKTDNRTHGRNVRLCLTWSLTLTGAWGNSWHRWGKCPASLYVKKSSVVSDEEKLDARDDMSRGRYRHVIGGMFSCPAVKRRQRRDLHDRGWPDSCCGVWARFAADNRPHDCTICRRYYIHSWIHPRGQRAAGCSPIPLVIHVRGSVSVREPRPA